MKNKSSIFNDKGFVLGLILIPISLGIHIFLKTSLGSLDNSNFRGEGIFFINFIMAAVYFLGVSIRGFFKKWLHVSSYSFRPFIIALILFAISCFTINIPYPIFDRFTTWVQVYLIIMHGALLALCFLDYLPEWSKRLVFFGLGLAAIGSLYFAIFLAPMMAIAFVGIVFFGLTIHLFVPAVMLITIMVQFVKQGKATSDKLAFFTGIMVPLIIIAMYSAQWHTTRQKIHQAQAEAITRPNHTMPEWLRISQLLDDGFFTERLLKSDLVYSTQMFAPVNFRSRNSLGEVMRHDPLVVIGNALMGEIQISRHNRIRILESRFDLRHETRRKLWSGSYLRTASVLSNIQVFPEYRLAYTEKIIRIRHDNKNARRPQEALYTFHLPEGSVASSLSLWIDGVEQKSRLTTKKKAKRAYNKIVGVERRDPAVLHWQEGQTITVRVFPCTNEEERIFKIGITSPLTLEDDRLVLRNTYFQGPAAKDALETCRIEIHSSEEVDTEVPYAFEKIAAKKYEYVGDYNPSWQISCSIPPLSSKSFSFGNYSYHLTPASNLLVDTDIQNVYLDINKSWDYDQFEAVWAAVKDKNVFAFFDELIPITEENKDQIFTKLHPLQFSLFPLHAIEDIDQGLLITQAPSVSPMLVDLQKTDFVAGLKRYVTTHKGRIHVFSLSPDLNRFLQALKEFQVLDVATGSVAEMKGFLDKKKYVSDQLPDDRVALTEAQVEIVRDTATIATDAPDHLLRLFAYNKVMQDCGRNYFTQGRYADNELSAIANEAFIVTPVSSMIVLESATDYSRFNIDKNKNSLQNASTQSSGAVPEPHEWAMIVLLFLGVLFLQYKNGKSRYVPAIFRKNN